MKLSPILRFLLGFSYCLALDKDKEECTGPVIGIDLGTTYCCVGVFRNKQIEIIPNEQGHLTTPSYVAWTEEGHRLVGIAAKNQAPFNPKNTIYDVKRLIGRSYTSLKDEISKLHYEVVNQGDRPKIMVKIKGETVYLAPEEVSAMLIEKMKQIAEEYLGVPSSCCVVTVPAYFTNEQRQATKDAGTISGMNVIRTLSEPTAASMAYGLNKESKELRNILIYDLGGGTFDISVIRLEDGVFESKAVKGDTHLGGEDFDRNLYNYIVDKFQEAHGPLDISDRGKAMIRKKSEEAKIVLSSKTVADVSFDSLEGRQFSMTIGRKKFEELNLPLLRNTITMVEQAIKDSKFNKSQITDIVLIGGSTRIPIVRTLIQDFFGRKDLCQDINPDEAVAYGAAVQGAILTKQEGTKDLLVIDVTPLTLGIETVGGVLTTVIARNSAIPIKREQVFSTAADNQTQVSIDVYEGERKMTKDNKLLGRFTLSGIPPMPRGQPEIHVVFELDSNGILKVTANEKSTQNSNSITITSDGRSYSKEDIEKMIRTAEEFADQDKAAHDRVLAETGFKDLIDSIKSTLKNANFTASVNSNEIQKVESAIKAAEFWIEKYMENATMDEIVEEKNKLSNIFNEVTTMAQQAGGQTPGQEGEPMDTDL